MRKFLIINADDLGASSGINRGIIECHTRGVLTSTSLMVTGRAALEAAAIEEVNGDYRRHCRAARAVAEEHFEARAVATRLLRDLGLT